MTLETGPDEIGRLPTTMHAAIMPARAAAHREAKRPSGKSRQRRTIAITAASPGIPELLDGTSFDREAAAGIVTRKKAVTSAPRLAGLRRRINAAVPYQIAQAMMPALTL